MDAKLKQDIVSIITEGQDLTLATVRDDGWPQATTVSYASDGMTIYVGCGEDSQKARNLTRDPRVSLTINLPYSSWDEIRGLSIGGMARRLTTPDEMAKAGMQFMTKFAPEIGKAISGGGGVALFEITPQVVSLLDYRKGFGHHDLIKVD